MWKDGVIGYEGKRYKYYVKAYEEGSEFGINGGRISKLDILHDGKSVALYDREWISKPKDKGTKAVLEILIHDYN